MATTDFQSRNSDTISTPAFIDTDSCHCRLQQVPEAAADSEDVQAWRCIGHDPWGPFSGRLEKWYLQRREKKFKLRSIEMATGHLLPDTRTWYYLTLDERQRLQLRLSDSAENDQLHERCTGQVPEQHGKATESPKPLLVQRTVKKSSNHKTLSDNDPLVRGETPSDGTAPSDEESLGAGRESTGEGTSTGEEPPDGNKAPPNKEQVASEDGNSPEYEYLHSCLGGDRAVAVQMQNNSSWNHAISSLSYVRKAHIAHLAARRRFNVLSGTGLILAIDTVVILAMVLLNIRTYFKNKHDTSSGGKRFSRLNKPASFFDKNYQAKKYHSLRDDDIALESRITHVQRSDTAFGGNFTPIGAQKDDNELISDLDMFIASMSKCIGTEKFGLSFEFTDLKFQPKKAKKPILSEVTGIIDRGSLWGVMGASGAGKSTFVNVLMGKQACTGGSTKINGVPGDIKKYKKIIGYVPQDDIVLPELTVRENILHSARIRLPSNWGDEQIKKHVDILISCLQLAHVKDSLVGSAANPVISGGQRKRVSIGIELAAAPMALFLDEPTSGLDATSASSIMMTLKELSRLNITIITIIHQPRAEIFESLDSILLFGKGRVIFQGPEREVQPYFEGLGFNFPPSGNPADTIMDIIAGQGHLYKTSGDTGIWPLIHNWKQCAESPRFRRKSNPSTISTLPSTPGDSNTPNLSTNSSFLSTPTLAPSRASSARTAEALSLRRSIKSRGAPFHKQVYHCLLRSLLQQYRLRSSFFFEIFVSALGGFLIGLAQFKTEGVNFRGFFLPPYAILSSSIDYSSVPQMALLVGIAIGLIASSPGVKIFGEEKLVYWREASSGHNRFAYYLGKVLSTFPRMIVACLHFTATFMLLSTPRIDWGSAFLANLLYFYTIYGLASILSMLTRREDGPLLAVMASLIVGVLNGMSPNLSVVEDWHMSWFWRALPGTWLAEAYFEKNVGGLGYLYAIEHASEKSGYRLGKFGWDCCVLGIIGTVYRVLAFGGMRFLNQRGKG
ncbi:MAG: hypothetical protein Q9209_007814 [Squamulea sp. 1 TL-2023]